MALFPKTNTIISVFLMSYAALFIAFCYFLYWLFE